MNFERALLLKKSVLYKSEVRDVEVWLEGISEFESRRIVYFGNDAPFEITQDENMEWIEEGTGESERADFVGELIDRISM